MTDKKTKEITDDFYRFIRTEAMRENCMEEDIKEIIKKHIAL